MYDSKPTQKIVTKYFLISNFFRSQVQLTQESTKETNQEPESCHISQEKKSFEIACIFCNFDKKKYNGRIILIY